MTTTNHPWANDVRSQTKEQKKEVATKWRKDNQARLSARSTASYAPRKAKMQEQIDAALRAEVQREHNALMDDEA